jgi:hypothetical protein
MAASTEWKELKSFNSEELEPEMLAIQASDESPKQSLESLFIMPIQRLPRYVMLLQVCVCCCQLAEYVLFLMAVRFSVVLSIF